MGQWSIAPRILNLSTSWSYMVSFTIQPSYPCTHTTAGCVGPIASLDYVERRKISVYCHESNHKSSAIQPIAYSE
jgi:hypothetical protein